MPRLHRFLFAALCGATALAQPAPPDPELTARPVTAEERRTVLTELAKELEDRFVFPDVAKKYAALLREKLKTGAYEALTEAREFARKVTEDLQAVHSDKHLRLNVGKLGGPGQALRGPGGGGPRLEALEEAKMIGDIAYLKFNLFPPDEEVARRARNFLLAHADARAVIIDSRTNRGGTLDVMDAILPLLYARQQPLVRMDTRAAAAKGGPLVDSPTLVRQPSEDAVVRRDHIVIPDAKEKRLQSVPVFYLTSKRTGSAAEHLALAFQRTGRATLVGETTGGAGHFGGVRSFGDRFTAFVPVGRTYDADTNRGWEGTGVKPDVAVPADEALEEALRRARGEGKHP